MFKTLLLVFAAWTVGMEREVDEGVYATLVQQTGRWRLWRFATKNDTSCVLVRPADGRATPYPLGVGRIFYGGEPRVVVTIRTRVPELKIEGKNLSGKVRWRKVGDRFWSEENYGELPQPTEGTSLEVSRVSYEYPDLFVGRLEERGIITFSGIDVALKALEKCYYDNY